MKIYSLLVCITISKLFSFSTYSQNISISVNEVSVKKVIEEIEQKSEYTFFYNNSLIDISKTVSITATKEKIKKVLNRLFRSTNIDFKIYKNHVVLFPKNSKASPRAIKKLLDELDQRAKEQTKRSSEILKTPVSQSTVKGVVSASDGTPLPGVNILIKGTNAGALTDFDGNYTIAAKPGDVLVFSYVGFVTQEVLVNTNTVNITLQEDVSSLEEVVVVAYGVSSKEALTGSVTQIKSEEIAKRPIANLSSAIEGASPGVIVTAASGQPGAGQNVRIRGFGSFSASNAPLYVVDGIPTNGALNNINPADIENISILKDASSTALYGNKATNGVIIVTTKKGKSEVGEVSINISTGVTGRSIPEYDRIDAFDYYPIMWEALRNSNAIPGVDSQTDLDAANLDATNSIFSVLGYNPFNVPNNQIVGTDGRLNPNAQLLYNDFDWEGAITRTGLRRNADLSYQGASKNADYFVSLGYLNEDGYLIKTDFERITARVNVNFQAKPWLKLGANLAGNRSEGNQANIGGSGSFRNAFRFTRGIGPIYPIFAHDPVTGDFILDENGEREFDLNDNRPSGASTGRHIVVERLLDVDFDERSAINLRSYADITLADGLSFRANISYEEQNFYNTFFWNKTIGDGAPDGLGFKQYVRRKTTAFNQLFNYNKYFGEHNIDLLAGHESQQLVIDDFNGTRTLQVADGNLELINFVNTTDLESQRDEVNDESYFGRFNYNYGGKYYFSSSIRTDGSPRFAEERRWGTFWSVGGSWSIDKEDFISNISWINQLKLRSSYGELGNSRIQDDDNNDLYYPSLATFALANNNQGEPGVLRSNLGAPDLEWETSANFDVALEFGLFNRFRATVEYYNKESRNLIFNVPVALSDGAESKLENIGTLFNRGVEISLSYDILKTKDFSWNLTVNGATLKNEFSKLPQEEIINGTKKLRVGKGLFDYWIRDWYGVDPTDGSGLFVAEDPNATGVRIINGVAVTPFANNARFHYAGSAIPDLTGSINNQITYKQFSLTTLFTYQLGGDTLDFNYASIMSSGNYGAAKSVDILGRWQQPGDITDVPRMDAALASEWSGTSDRWLTDASFFNLRQVNLTYQFDSSLAKKLGVSSLNMYASAENIFSINARKGLNVQQQFNGNTSNAFTPARVITFGLNLKL
ncbi:SusC/RagA family TonB-linked outer membrane protein [Aquimarina sp. MMG016]|uniref:SusC/RagA family TonB-linked outer membrane protein n=1 Tax=Aquimarina sp. MMG016 TaxID=2822690 RepID=UPI001B3A63F9|nr:SusC/RagA family TonB-linked outer membrane protein [Aquimarina sp. MMG016]MBQ4819396.1 SusC/RagA family TonB-linked outer membrane protein [Aquimarina sp. MMG016]